jgi:hypothetical protein
MESRSKAKVSGESKFKDKRVRLSSAAMAGPQSQNPKGRRLIPVLLKQGLMLLPLSLKILGKKRLASKHKSRAEKCCKDKAFQTLKVKTLGVNLIRPRTSSFFNLCFKTNSKKGELV